MKKNNLLILVSVILLAFFILGCFNPPAYTPDVKLELSPTFIDVKDNEYSPAMKVSIIKKDNDGRPVVFTLKFVTPNRDFLKFADTSKLEIESYSITEQTLLSDDRVSKEFLIWGKKVPGMKTAAYTPKIEVYYQGKLLDSKEFEVNIN